MTQDDQLSDYLEAILNVIGVIPKSKHTPVAWPAEPVPKPTEYSKPVWMPEYEGQQPPF